MRWTRRVLVGVVTAAVAIAVAVAASAALDAPSRSSEAATLINAPRGAVWNTLMEFQSYPRWNPYMRSVRGQAERGGTLEIQLDPPGGGDEEVSAKVYVYKPPRKLRWQSRLLVPGVRDLEYEVIVAPVGRNRTYVVQRARYEGLLAVFVDPESTRGGLVSMARALKLRVEAAPSGKGEEAGA